MNWINTGITISSYAAFIIAGVLYAYSKAPSETIKNYESLVKSFKERIEMLEAQSLIDTQNHLASVKGIADLQGQIKVYKELPLQEMSNALQKISDTNQLILLTLNSSARLLATDTKDAASAVKEVKADLKANS